jgi:hypothetical protein
MSQIPLRASSLTKLRQHAGHRFIIPYGSKERDERRGSIIENRTHEPNRVQTARLLLLLVPLLQHHQSPAG